MSIFSFPIFGDFNELLANSFLLLAYIVQKPHATVPLTSDLLDPVESGPDPGTYSSWGGYFCNLPKVENYGDGKMPTLVLRPLSLGRPHNKTQHTHTQSDKIRYISDEQLIYFKCNSSIWNTLKIEVRNKKN